MPRSSLEWFQAGENAGPLTASADQVKVVEPAAACFTSIDPSRQQLCLRAALSIACHAATLFEPRFAGPAALAWFGPDGQPAPNVDFPRDFIDRRKVVSWSLHRLTVGMPKDVPIFSSQARITMQSDSFVSFTNYGKPAATLMADESVIGVAGNENVPDQPVALPPLESAPNVRVLMHASTGFEDVIFYTALFNFSRAFSAFLTGPWPALRSALRERMPLFQMLVLSPAEARAVDRASLATIESAWERCYQQPLALMKSSMFGILSHALSEVQR
jgi:hypothetical protein